MIILNIIGMIAFLYLTCFVIDRMDNNWLSFPTFVVAFFTIVVWMVYTMTLVTGKCV